MSHERCAEWECSFRESAAAAITGGAAAAAAAAPAAAAVASVGLDGLWRT